jgi:hypothetical protein
VIDVAEIGDDRIEVSGTGVIRAPEGSDLVLSAVTIPSAPTVESELSLTGDSTLKPAGADWKITISNEKTIIRFTGTPGTV